MRSLQPRTRLDHCGVVYDHRHGYLQWVVEPRGVDSRTIDSRYWWRRRHESLFRDHVRISTGTDPLKVFVLYPADTTDWNDRGTDHWRVIRRPRTLDLGILFQLYLLHIGLACHSFRC